eukprot:9098518-Ditylum_brightwellii.AAC.1
MPYKRPTKATATTTTTTKAKELECTLNGPYWKASINSNIKSNNSGSANEEVDSLADLFSQTLSVSKTSLTPRIVETTCLSPQPKFGRSTGLISTSSNAVITTPVKRCQRFVSKNE